MHGVGEAKAERYAEAFLGEIAAHADGRDGRDGRGGRCGVAPERVAREGPQWPVATDFGKVRVRPRCHTPVRRIRTSLGGGSSCRTRCRSRGSSWGCSVTGCCG